jgi:hypothetical protein
MCGTTKDDSCSITVDFKNDCAPPLVNDAKYTCEVTGYCGTRIDKCDRSYTFKARFEVECFDGEERLINSYVSQWN